MHFSLLFACVWRYLNLSLFISWLISAAMDSLWMSLAGYHWFYVLVSCDGGLYGQVESRTDEKDFQWWLLCLILQKCDLPLSDFQCLQVRALMVVADQSPSRLSCWSRNQFQLHSWCCTQIRGACSVLIVFTDKWLGTKTQREQIRGHWKTPLLMKAFPSLLRDSSVVLWFALPPSPSSAENGKQKKNNVES